MNVRKYAVTVGVLVALCSFPVSTASALIVGAPNGVVADELIPDKQVQLTLSYPERVNEFDPLPFGARSYDDLAGIRYEVTRVDHLDISDENSWDEISKLTADDVVADGESQILVTDSLGRASGTFTPGLYKITELDQRDDLVHASDMLVVLPLGSQQHGRWDYTAEVIMKLEYPDPPIEETPAPEVTPEPTPEPTSELSKAPTSPTSEQPRSPLANTGAPVAGLFGLAAALVAGGVATRQKTKGE